MRMFLRRLSPALSLSFLALALQAAAATDAREDVFKAYQKMMGSKFSVEITTLTGSDTVKSHGDYDTVERSISRTTRWK